MKKIAKPMLSARVVRGLDNIYSFMSSELESGQLERANGGPFSAKEIDAMIAAMSFIGRSVKWYRQLLHSGGSTSIPK